MHQRASPKARTLKLLRGSVPVTLLVEQKPIVVTDKVMSAKGKKFKADGVQFSFEDVNKQPNGQYQIKMTITNDAAESDPNWINNLVITQGEVIAAQFFGRRAGTLFESREDHHFHAEIGP